MLATLLSTLMLASAAQNDWKSQVSKRLDALQPCPNKTALPKKIGTDWSCDITYASNQPYVRACLRPWRKQLMHNLREAGHVCRQDSPLKTAKELEKDLGKRFLRYTPVEKKLEKADCEDSVAELKALTSFGNAILEEAKLGVISKPYLEHFLGLAKKVQEKQAACHQQEGNCEDGEEDNFDEEDDE